jgi:cytosine/adenosine deaminase-related metal-dependent hydrolase
VNISTPDDEPVDPLAALDEILAPAPAHDPTAGTAAPSLPGFEDVHEFVTQYLCPRWARVVRDPDNTFRWCAKWWDHPVALDRLTALWQAHQVLHAEGGTGPARWWREYGDPALLALAEPRSGPFAGCGPDRHRLPPTLPSDPFPDRPLPWPDR